MINRIAFVKTGWSDESSDNPISWTLVLTFSMLINVGCGISGSDTQEAIQETREQCLYRITGSKDKEEIRILHELESVWRYSAQRVETVYEKSFFFLLTKEVVFSHKADDNMKTIVSSTYSCSGVPPHVLLLERSYSRYKNNKIKLIKTEVMEAGSLTLAPTDLDESMDVLYYKIKSEKRKE